MLKLLMMTVLLLAPTHSFAADLIGSAPDVNGVGQTAILLEEVLENGSTRPLGKGAWGPGLFSDTEGSADQAALGASPKIKVTMKNAGVAVGTYTSEPMTVEDAVRMVDDSDTLNDYLRKGGKLSINANPSAIELARAVQKLESSKDPEVLKLYYSSKMDNLKKDFDQLKEKYKTCREDRKIAIRERREGKPLPKREVEIRGGLHNGTVVRDAVLPPVIGPNSSAK
ncbi:MAG: hypothetical protein AABZ31_11160 [Bdellovibrionota bacterium]